MKNKILIPFLALVILLTTVSFKKDFFEIAKQIEIFTTLFKELNMNYVDETTPSALINKAIKGMLDGLDPYTVHWNEQEVEDVAPGERHPDEVRHSRPAPLPLLGRCVRHGVGPLVQREVPDGVYIRLSGVH